MGLTVYERETVIIFNDEETTAQITSSQRTVWTKMEKRGVKPDKEEMLDGVVVTRFYTVPKSWVKISPLKRVSEKQRQAAGERLKAARQKNVDSLP